MKGSVPHSVTIDDLTIDWLATALVRLPRFQGAPALGIEEFPPYMKDETYPRGDGNYLDMNAVLNDLAGTDYGEYLARLVEWAEAAAPCVDVVLDYQELRDGTPSDGPNLLTVPDDNDDIGLRISLSLWGDEREAFSAYHCRLDYWFDGGIDIRLATFPDGTETVDPYVWDDLPRDVLLTDTNVAEFDVSSVVSALDERMPYVTSRTVELAETCGYPDSQAHYEALNEAGLSNDAIAERRGVKDVRSYRSKATATTEAALRAFLAKGGRGIPRQVIASTAISEAGQPETMFKNMYVCVPSWYQSGGPTEPGNGAKWKEAPGAWLITISNMQRKEYTDDEGNTQFDHEWGLSVTTDDFPSLSKLLDYMETRAYHHDVAVATGEIDRIQAGDADHWKRLLAEIPEAYKRAANYTGRRTHIGIRDLDAVDPAGWWA